jgi:hypothetical protein
MSDINKFTTKEVLNKVLLDSSGNSVAANSHTSQEALNAVLDTSNNRLNVSLGGSNTISGDVTITGDLTVQGGGTQAFDEIVEGSFVVKPASANLDVSGAPNGSLSIGSPSSTLQASVMGRTTSNATALHLFASATDANTLGDMRFNVRENNDSTFATLTNPAFKFIHYTTDLVTILRNGYVGIGLTDPNSTFMVGGSTSAGGDIAVANTDTTISDGDSLGGFYFKGKDDSASSYGIGAKIVAICTEDWNEATSEGTSLNFYTTDNGSATNDLRMIINHNGEVFFGESAQGLSISGLTSGKGTITGINQALSAYKGLVFNATDHSFKISGTEQATIDSSGNLNLNERLTFSGTTTQATASINLNSNNYLYVTGGTSGLSLTAEGGADKIQIEDGGGSGRIIFECTSTQVAKFDTNSRISLSNNDNNTDNTVFGSSAFNASSDNGSDNNTVFGANAMGTGTVSGATHNVAIGASSLNDMTSGDNNVAVGSSAMLNATTATQNVAIGRQAIGLGVATGSGNIAVGYASLYDLTSGENNIGIGSSALGNVLDGGYNIAIGVSSLLDANAGESQNIAIGIEAMRDVEEGTNSRTADNNVAIGSMALKGGTLAGSQDLTHNVAIGYRALDATGVYGQLGSVAIGSQALGVTTYGSANTAVGYNSGDTIITGSNNTLIGYNSDVSANDASNQTVVGKDATGQADNSVTLGNSSVTAVYMAEDSGATVHCAGIQFPASQSASADANALDDYEEGDYDITFTCGTSGTITLNSSYNRASYVKIGSFVSVTGLAIVSSVSSPSGFISVNLPFTPANLTDRAGDSAISLEISGVASANVADFQGAVNEATAVFYIQLGDGATRQSDSAEQMQASTQIHFSVQFRV